MLSGKMLPIHFPPAPDELLSSWYVRLAHANRLKAETFGTVLWGRHLQLWNRDIDRLSPEWLVRDLGIRTGTPYAVAWDSTLRSYENQICTDFRSTGISPWLLPVQMYHRKHKWPGIQYCPNCLKEDKEPYFRKRWRLALYTTCYRHGVQLCDHCPQCNEPLMFHRRDLGKSKELDIEPLSLCYECNYDLSLTKTQPPEKYEKSAGVLAKLTAEWLENDSLPTLDSSFYMVLHQICKLLLSEKWGKGLRDFVSDQLGQSFEVSPDTPKDLTRAFFEHRTIPERHQILHCSYWLLSEPDVRLKVAIDSKVLRINRLYRDLHLMPDWYQKIMSKLPHRDTPALR